MQITGQFIWQIRRSAPTINLSTHQLINLSTHQLVNSSTYNYFAKLNFLFHRAFGKSHIIVKKSK